MPISSLTAAPHDRPPRPAPETGPRDRVPGTGSCDDGLGYRLRPQRARRRLVAGGAGLRGHGLGRLRRHADRGRPRRGPCRGGRREEHCARGREHEGGGCPRGRPGRRTGPDGLVGGPEPGCAGGPPGLGGGPFLGDRDRERDRAGLAGIGEPACRSCRARALVPPGGRNGDQRQDDRHRVGDGHAGRLRDDGGGGGQRRLPAPGRRGCVCLRPCRGRASYRWKRGSAGRARPRRRRRPGRGGLVLPARVHPTVQPRRQLLAQLLSRPPRLAPQPRALQTGEGQDLGPPNRGQHGRDQRR